MKTTVNRLLVGATLVIAGSQLMVGCSKNDNSRTQDVGLRFSNGQQLVVWMQDGMVLSKTCMDTEMVLRRDCQSGEQPRATAYALFHESFAGQLGVAAPYRDFNGLARLLRDKMGVEALLNEPGHTPDELAAAEDRLNFMSDMEFRLKKVQRVNAYLESGSDIIYSEGMSELFPSIVASLNGNLDIWLDRVNSRYFTILKTTMNWYDAMEVPRVVDNFGNPSEPFQKGCSLQLGPGWRLPAGSEVLASYKAGLKQMRGIRNANPFWTSESVDNPNTPSAYAYSVDIPAAQSRPKFQQVFTVCVRPVEGR